MGSLRAGPNPVLLGFITLYVSIVAFSLAAAQVLESRLPVGARALASYCVESELIAIETPCGLSP
jgi:hypothetical protein